MVSLERRWYNIYLSCHQPADQTLQKPILQGMLDSWFLPSTLCSVVHSTNPYPNVVFSDMSMGDTTEHSRGPANRHLEDSFFKKNKINGGASGRRNIYFSFLHGNIFL